MSAKDLTEEQIYDLFSQQIRRDEKLLRDIAEYRKQHQPRLTQTDVANIMQTDQCMISRLESGNSNARMRTVREYAVAVGVEIHHEVRPYTPHSVSYSWSTLVENNCA